MQLSDYERRFSYKVRTRIKHKFILISVFLIICIISFLIFSMIKLEPLVAELALSSVTDTITIAVNEVISEKVIDGTIKYDDLVSLEKDSDGNITALITNMSNINALQAEITTAVAELFKDTGETVVSIPLGNVIGGAVFSGKGPNISVKVLSVSNVNTSFRNEFTSAGINQTRHQIMMEDRKSVV